MTKVIIIIFSKLSAVHCHYSRAHGHFQIEMSTQADFSNSPDWLS